MCREGPSTDRPVPWPRRGRPTRPGPNVKTRPKSGSHCRRTASFAQSGSQRRLDPLENHRTSVFFAPLIAGGRGPAALKRREEVYVIAVRVAHDGVALPPGRVPRLMAALAEGGQLRVLLVDGRWGGEEEGQGHPVAAGRGCVVGVDLPDKLIGVPSDAQSARCRSLSVGLVCRPLPGRRARAAGRRPARPARRGSRCRRGPIVLPRVILLSACGLSLPGGGSLPTVKEKRACNSGTMG